MTPTRHLARLCALAALSGALVAVAPTAPTSAEHAAVDDSGTTLVGVGVDQQDRATTVYAVGGHLLAATDADAPVELSAPTGFVGGSATSAQNRSGAAVVAWDAPDGDGTALWVSTRVSTTGAWSAPVELDDPTAGTHGATVAISGSGEVTVAYLRGETPDLVTRQSTGSGWSAPLTHSTAPVQEARVAVSANGTGFLVWIQHEPGDQVIVRTSRRLDGAWTTPESHNNGDEPLSILAVATNAEDVAAASIVMHRVGREYVRVMYTWPGQPTRWSGGGLSTTPTGVVPQVSMTVNSLGTVGWLYTWAEDQPDRAVYLSYSKGDEAARRVLMSGPGDSHDPVLVSNDGYRFMAAWLTTTAEGTTLTVRGGQQGNGDTVADPNSTYLGAATGAPAAAMTTAGDMVVRWPDASGSDPYAGQTVSGSYTRTQLEFDPDLAVPVGWDEAARHDVRTRAASTQGVFGAHDRWLTATTRTSASFRAHTARTTCFSARRYAASRVGAWSAESCTTTAVDDTRLVGDGWRTTRSASLFGHSATWTSATGRTLTLPDVSGRAFALLVRKAATDGTVSVHLGDRDLGTFDLAARRTRERVVIPVARFRDTVSGDLRVTVTSTGRPVVIDGVYVAAR